MVKSRNCQGPEGDSSKLSGKPSIPAYSVSQLQLVIQRFPLPEGKESFKGRSYCVPQLKKQDTASSQIRYACNLKAREAFASEGLRFTPTG